MIKTFITVAIVFILSIFLLVGGAFYFFLNTPAGFSMLVRTAWDQSLPANKLSEFSVEKVRTNPLEGIEISGLAMKILVEGTKISMNAGKLGFEMPPAAWRQSPVFWTENLSIKTRDFSLAGGEIKFGLKPLQATPTGFGSISIEKLTLQPRYQLKNIQGVISSLDPITIRPVQGETLNGILEAEISVRPKDGRLVIKGRLHDADMSTLEYVAGENFKNAKGKFQSEFNFEAEKGEIKTIWISAESPKPGGEMNSDLFRILLDYLPSNADKRLIREQILTWRTVPFDEARFTLKNVSERSFQGRFNFTSRKLNLILNLDLDVNFEDVEIMKSISKIMQVLGRIENEE